MPTMMRGAGPGEKGTRMSFKVFSLILQKMRSHQRGLQIIAIESVFHLKKVTGQKGETQWPKTRQVYYDRAVSTGAIEMEL